MIDSQFLLIISKTHYITKLKNLQYELKFSTVNLCNTMKGYHLTEIRLQQDQGYLANRLSDIGYQAYRLFPKVNLYN